MPAQKLSSGGGRAATWEEAVRWLISQPDQAEFVRDCYFDLPLVDAAERYVSSAEWRVVRRWIPGDPGVALDLGAGNGITSYALAREGWSVTSVEPDPSDLVGAGAIRSLADSVSFRVEVVSEFGESLPFADASFDLVLCRQVMHHARDLKQFCREIGRVLRPGAVFVAIRDHVISGPAQLPKFLASHPLHRLYGGENAFTVAQYADAIRGAGLAIERRFGSFDSPVNYAPQTPETISQEVARRLRAIPGAGVLAHALLTGALTQPAAFWALSRLDRRPGRLASFVCRKPAAGAQ